MVDGERNMTGYRRMSRDFTFVMFERARAGDVVNGCYFGVFSYVGTLAGGEERVAEIYAIMVRIRTSPLEACVCIYLDRIAQPTGLYVMVSCRRRYL